MRLPDGSGKLHKEFIKLPFLLFGTSPRCTHGSSCAYDYVSTWYTGSHTRLPHSHPPLLPPPSLRYNNTAAHRMHSIVQLTPKGTAPPPPLYSSRFSLRQEGMMTLHRVIAYAVDHGNHRLQQRRFRSILKPTIYACQIVWDYPNRVQVLRSISSCLWCGCPRVSTVSNMTICLAHTTPESLSIRDYYDKVKLVSHYSAFVFVCDGCMGGMRLVSKFWVLLRVNTKWKGAGFGGTAHSSRYVPSGLNDLYILVLSTSTHLRDFPCVHLSSIWMNVRTLIRKCLYRSGITTERGDEGGGGSSAHSPTSAPRGFKGSNTLTPSRETCRKLEQHRITDGVNGSSHQAVAWTIRSPLIASTIHITGVYVSPSEGEVEEFFHTLTQQDHYPQ